MTDAEMAALEAAAALSPADPEPRRVAVALRLASHAPNIIARVREAEAAQAGLRAELWAAAQRAETMHRRVTEAEGLQFNARMKAERDAAREQLRVETEAHERTLAMHEAEMCGADALLAERDAARAEAARMREAEQDRDGLAALVDRMNAQDVAARKPKEDG